MQSVQQLSRLSNKLVQRGAAGIASLQATGCRTQAELLQAQAKRCFAAESYTAQASEYAQKVKDAAPSSGSLLPWALAGAGGGALVYYLRPGETKQAASQAMDKVAEKSHQMHLPPQIADTAGDVVGKVSKATADSMKSVIQADRGDRPVDPRDEATRLPEFCLQDHRGQDMTRGDIEGNFMIMYVGSAAKAKEDPVKSDLAKMRKVYRLIVRKSNMQMMTPIFVDNAGGKVMDLHKALDEAPDRSTLGLCGPDAAKIVEAGKKFVESAEQGPVQRTAVRNPAFYIADPEAYIISAWGHDTDDSVITDTVSLDIQNYKLTHPTWHKTKSVKHRVA